MEKEIIQKVEKEIAQKVEKEITQKVEKDNIEKQEERIRKMHQAGIEPEKIAFYLDVELDFVKRTVQAGQRPPKNYRKNGNPDDGQ